MWKVVILLTVSSCLAIPLQLVQYAALPYQQYQQYQQYPQNQQYPQYQQYAQYQQYPQYQQYQQYQQLQAYQQNQPYQQLPLQRLQVVQALPNRGVVSPQNIVYLANSNDGSNTKQLTLFENLQNWASSFGSSTTEPPVEDVDSITEPTTPAPAGEEEKKPLPENEKLENAEPLPVQPLQPEQPQAQQPVVGVMPASTTRLILGQPQFFGNFAALQQGALVLRQQPLPVFPGAAMGVNGVPYQPGRPPLASSDEVETLPLAAKLKGTPSRFSSNLLRFQPVKRKQANDEENDEQTDEVQSEPEEAPTIAQSKPAAIALAGPGGTASAGPLGQALVGDGGIAISAPSATAVSGGARPPAIAPPQAVQAYKTFYSAMSKPETLLKTFGQ